MPTTPIYALPYPAAADPADVPVDMQELAERVEALLGTIGIWRIADSTLGAAATSIDFPSIPQTYAHLQLVCSLRGDAAAATAGVQLRINGDAGATYFVERLRATAGTVSAFEGLTTTGFLADISGGTAPANHFSPVVFELPNYRIAGLAKAAVWTEGYLSAVAAGGVTFQNGFGAWHVAGAITRLTLVASTGNLVSGSRATLYGLA